MSDLFDDLEDVRDKLEAEWNEFISIERNAHLRRAAEEFDAAISVKKRGWMKRRLLKQLNEMPDLDPSPIARERERHLPVGTRLKLKQIPIGSSELFESQDRDVIQAIRNCAYSLSDEAVFFKTEATQSETGIILAVTRLESDPSL